MEGERKGKEKQSMLSITAKFVLYMRADVQCVSRIYFIVFNFLRNIFETKKQN